MNVEHYSALDPKNHLRRILKTMHKIIFNILLIYNKL